MDTTAGGSNSPNTATSADPSTNTTSIARMPTHTVICPALYTALGAFHVDDLNREYTLDACILFTGVTSISVYYQCEAKQTERFYFQWRDRARTGLRKLKRQRNFVG